MLGLWLQFFIYLLGFILEGCFLFLSFPYFWITKHQVEVSLENKPQKSNQTQNYIASPLPLFRHWSRWRSELVHGDPSLCGQTSRGQVNTSSSGDNAPSFNLCSPILLTGKCSIILIWQLTSSLTFEFFMINLLFFPFYYWAIVFTNSLIVL